MQFDGDTSDFDSFRLHYDNVVAPMIEDEMASIAADAASRVKAHAFKAGSGAYMSSIEHGTRGQLPRGSGGDTVLSGFLGGDDDAVFVVTSSRRGGGQLEGFVRVNAEHASFVEWDTKEHIIVPKDRRTKGQAGAKTRRGQRMLKFQVGGSDVFARKVEHPGTKGQHILETCMTDTEVGTRIEAAFERGLGLRRSSK